MTGRAAGSGAGIRASAGSVAAVRALLIGLLLLAWCPALEWSGTITIQEFITQPTPADEDRDELRTYLRELRARLATVVERRRGDTDDRLLASDEAFLRAEIDQTALAIGGEVLIGSTTVWTDGSRLRIDGNGLVIIDQPQAAAWAWGAGGFRRLPLGDPPETATGGVILSGVGIPTDGERRLFAVTLPDGRRMQVRVRSDRPNPFALVAVPSGTTPVSDLLMAMAALPGQPELLDLDGPTPRRMVFNAVAGRVEESRFDVPGR